MLEAESWELQDMQFQAGPGQTYSQQERIADSPNHQGWKVTRKTSVEHEHYKSHCICYYVKLGLDIELGAFIDLAASGFYMDSFAQ